MEQLREILGHKLLVTILNYLMEILRSVGPKANGLSSVLCEQCLE